MLPIKNSKKKLEAFNCWASTRLDRLWRFDWWCTADSSPPHVHSLSGRDYAGYPCKTFSQLGIGPGPWVSGPGMKNRPIYFRLDLLMVHMVRSIEVGWLGKPSTWEIQSSLDMLIWESVMNSDNVGDKWEGEQGFIRFKKQHFMKGIRFVITTGEPYVGISKLNIYKEQWTVMI